MSSLLDPVRSSNAELEHFGHALRRYLTSELGFDPFQVEELRTHIVGGAFRDYLGNDGVVAKDIDVTFSGGQAAFEGVLAQIRNRYDDDRITVNKTHNWSITPYLAFNPGVEIQISRHPAIDQFFSLCSESMNAFLYDGEQLLATPQAELDAQDRSFELLNVDSTFTTPERASLILGRIDKFRARGYTYRRDLLHPRLVELAGAAPQRDPLDRAVPPLEASAALAVSRAPEAIMSRRDQ